MGRQTGHVFVLRGDVLSLDCDAYAVSANRANEPSSVWRSQALFPAGAAGAPSPVSPGRSVVPWGGGTSLPAPYVVPVAGNDSRAVSWYTDAIRVFLERALADVGPRVSEVHENDRRRRPLPRLVVPFLGSGKGGKLDERGALLRGTLDTLWAFASSHPADVVLVLRDGKAYDAAQSYRRHMGEAAWSGLASKHLPAADALAIKALRGELALFLGAGVSMAAGLPSWSVLLERLAEGVLTGEELRHLGNLSPLDQAELLERRLAAGGPGALGSRVAEIIGAHPRHALSHALLAQLPVREVVTTNYDELFENAFAAARGLDRREALHVIPYDGPPFREKPWLMKLHGCVRRPNDIVLSRRTFLQYDTSRGALAGMLAGLLVTRHMLFVGSSFSDDNVLRVAEEVQRLWATSGDANRSREARLGTNLAVGSKPLLDELWKDDFDWISLGDDGHGARALELFLDRMAASSSTGASYLFEDSFDNLITDEDQKLRLALQQFLAGVEGLRGPALDASLEGLRARFGLRRGS